MVFDAVVLAGGRARRLGGVAKPQLEVAGVTLLDRAVAAVAEAQRVVVVGPQQPVTGAVTFCREEPADAGPVAALAAALPRTIAETVVLLAADLPLIAPAVPVLLDALPAAGAALLVDGSGQVNYLAGAWRRRELAAALGSLGNPDGASMRTLAALVEQVHVPDRTGWGRDCDTWEDLEDLRNTADLRLHTEE